MKRSRITRKVKQKPPYNPMGCSRWVSICVDSFDHPALSGDPYCKVAAWAYLIAQAAWCERRINHKGKIVALKRGQILIGRAYLADVWGWSERNVRTFLTTLVREGMIEISDQSDGHFANVATICNYDKYQHAAENGGQSNDQCPTSDRPVTDQTLTNTQPYNSEEKDSYAPQPSAAGAKPKKASRGSRLTEGMQLPDEWRRWAVEDFGASPVAVADQFARFHDYWIAQPGQKGVKANWLATWKNWCRSARERTMARSAPRNGQRAHDGLVDLEAQRRANDKLARGQAAMAQMWEDAT